MKYKGELEIDERRGVIYFHSNKGITVLRICGLKKGIPLGHMIDISHMHGEYYIPFENGVNPICFSSYCNQMDECKTAGKCLKSER